MNKLHSCSLDLKSKHSMEFCANWFFIVLTFDTKVTKYLCSGWVFFSPDKFRLFN